MQTRKQAQSSYTPNGGGVGTVGPTNGSSSGVDASRRGVKPSGAGSTTGNAADDRYLNTRKRFLILSIRLV
jgi:hypothetical protein